jgi:hypothetical protein
MLRSLKEIFGYSLKALDGEIGQCKDFILDSQKWVIRYMQADTGTWLTSRQVLISPVSLGQPRWAEREFPINLKKSKIEDSPGLNHHIPVSRHYEIAFFQYFGWPYYWNGDHLWGQRPNPWPNYKESFLEESKSDESYNPELRLVSEIINYRVMASDERFGDIHDIIVNDKDWSVSYIVVDYGSWLFGKKILVEPRFVSNINYFQSNICLNVNSDDLKEFPHYDSQSPVNTEFESVKYDFNGRPH